VRVLLTANASYLPPRGGATRSNLLWLEHLASAGHPCCVVAAALADAPEKLAQMREEQLHVDWSHSAYDGVETSTRGLMTVHTVAERTRQLAVLREQVREFRPDWILVSSEDLGHVLLRAASHLSPGRVVYLAHTPQFFPFGPASWNPDREGAELVAQAAGVVAIGHHTAEYIRRHTGRPAAVIHPPIYGSGPFRNHGVFERGLVTLINPCAVKGIGVLLGLADRLPRISFGALPGWGTTREDRAAMAQRPNIELLPNCKNIEDILQRTRVLLMPSLWYEGFGLSVMEAMLHGIPVIASDSGGLQEAKLGTRFVVPVRGIERYEPIFDERAMPKPVIEPPDLDPWAEALGTLLGNRAVYESESRAAQAAALQFVGGLDSGRFEEFLTHLQPARAAAAVPVSMESLSPEKRALLLQRLRKRGAAAKN
jgi:glycosyltransferase involved in cell wall biosynthesis